MKIRGFGATTFLLGLLSTSIGAQTFYDGGSEAPTQAPSEADDVVQVVPQYPSAPAEEPGLKPLKRLANSTAYIVYETDSEVNFEVGNGVRFVKGQMLILARKDLGISVGDFVAEMKRGSTLWITGDIRGDVEIVNLDDVKRDAVRLICLRPGETQMRVLAPSQTLRLRQGQLDWTSTDLGSFWLESLFFQDLRNHPKDRFEERLLYSLARGAGVSGRVLMPPAPEQPPQMAVEGRVVPEANSGIVPLTATALKLGEKTKKLVVPKVPLKAPKKSAIVQQPAAAKNRPKARRRAYSTLQSFAASRVTPKKLKPAKPLAKRAKSRR